MWNEREVHRFDTEYNMWPWPLTSLMNLTLDVSKSNFEIAVSQELLVWLMWNEKEVSWYDTGPTVRHCPLTTPMTLTLEFQGQSLKLLYLRNGAADWHGTKRMWVIHSWPWYWVVWPWWGGRMYRIVNRVTSDVGVPSTYVVGSDNGLPPVQCQATIWTDAGLLSVGTWGAYFSEILMKLKQGSFK